MSWTAPSTWAGGQLVNAADFNAQIRDNMLWLGGTGGVISLPGYGQSTTAAATTSTTYVSLAAPQVGGLVTAGGYVTIFFGISVSHSIGGTACSFCIFMDGTNISGGVAHATAPATNYFFNVSGVYQHIPTSASHTYQIGWASTAGTLSLDTNVNAWICAIEQRR